MSLPTELVTMVTVAMVTCLWVHASLCNLDIISAILALFTSCISMVTQWLMLLGNVGHLAIQERRPLWTQQYLSLDCKMNSFMTGCV